MRCYSTTFVLADTIHCFAHWMSREQISPGNSRPSEVATVLVASPSYLCKSRMQSVNRVQVKNYLADVMYEVDTFLSSIEMHSDL